MPIPALPALLALLIFTAGATAESAPATDQPKSIDSIFARKRSISTADKIRAKRLNIQLYGDVVQEVIRRMNEPLQGTESEVRLEKVQRDIVGYTHVRLGQFYRGIRLAGQPMIAHINKNSVLFQIDGSLAKEMSLDTKPGINTDGATGAAVRDAICTVCLDSQCTRVGPADIDSIRKYEDLLSTGHAPVRAVGEPELAIWGRSLVYVVKVREEIGDRTDWKYHIDAATGEVRLRENLVVYAQPPLPMGAGVDTSVSGVKLKRETHPVLNDSLVTIVGWKSSTSGQYHLLTKTSPALWGVYDFKNFDTPQPDSGCDWVKRSNPAWDTTDRSAISLAKNGESVLNWLADSFSLDGVDGAGSRITLGVRWLPNYSNARFRPLDTTCVFGDGDGQNPGWGPLVALQTVAHEMGHAVSCFAWGPSGVGEARAVDEAYSDIFAASAEFACQPDSCSAWPSAVPGTADWIVGEDEINGYTGGRDFKFSFRTSAQKQQILYPYASNFEGNYYYQYAYPHDEYNREPYEKMGVQCFAFYLLANGADSVCYNEGNAYGPFRGIGVAAAAQVAVLANLAYHLYSYSMFSDSKRAWLHAAVQLVDEAKIPAYSVAVVDSAWSAAGVKSQLIFRSTAYGGTAARLTRQGNLKVFNQTGRQYPSSWTGTLPFSYKGSKQVAFMPDIRNGSCTWIDSAIVDSCSAYLDTTSQLSPGLTIRGPEGQVVWHVDTLGVVRVRNRELWYQ